MPVEFCRKFTPLLPRHWPKLGKTREPIGNANLEFFLFLSRVFTFNGRNMSITPLTPADIPVLLDLIRELARFEKLEHEMEATVESLTDAFFGPQPAAGALLARSEGEPAGYAIYFFTFSSFLGRAGIWLEDIYVRSPFRKQGLGRGLIRAVARIGVERGCGRFEWTALDWNERAMDFYRGLGATAMDEWVLLRLSPDGLRELAGDP